MLLLSISDEIGKLPIVNPDSIPDIQIDPEKAISDLRSINWETVSKTLTETVLSLGFKILAAVLVFYVGRFIIKKLHNLLRTILLSRNVDGSLITFLLSLFKFTFMFVLVITVIGMLGIETSSFIAIFASAGIAVGMALSGTLQNFAGGVLLLLLKPYKIGDYIEYDTFKGFVKEIQIFHTIITTYNNETIVIPNGGLSTGTINNFSHEENHRVEWRVGISYGDDFEVAKREIMAILEEDERILSGEVDEQQTTADELKALLPDDEEMKRLPWYKRLFYGHKRLQAIAAKRLEERREQLERKVMLKRDCTPSVHIENMGDSSVDLIVRAWCPVKDYWPVFYSVNEQMYTRLPKVGINFPFPQLDVHLPKE